MLTYIVLLLFIGVVFIRPRRQKGVVAFFHPYCNAGGGGERVLWCAIRTMQQKWPNIRYIVYSGDREASKEQILMKAKQRFGVEVDPQNLDFIFLRYRRLVEADLYPRFTLLLQTIAGFFLGLEALFRLNPEIFIDSMGYPFTMPLFKWVAGARVMAYAHYPTISCDMIDLVERRESSYNNDEAIANSATLSSGKLLYYRFFAFLYRLAGYAADLVIVNGSWTKGHIDRMWRCSSRIIFPPCDVRTFLDLESVAESRYIDEKVFRILSIGQIRPEKNHALQLRVLKSFIDRLNDSNMMIKPHLTIAGGCRNEEDEQRVKSLKKLADELNITDYITWKLNVPYDELLQLLTETMVSIHTMWNEHFGISVVEGVAAGTIMLAHNSGGPKLDIVTPAGENTPQTGYLASTVEEFVSALDEIASLPSTRRQELRTSARLSVDRFTEEKFAMEWIEAVSPLI